MEHKIQPLIPGNTDGLEEIARQLLEGVTPDDQGSGSDSGGNLGIGGNGNYWTISGVNYRDRIHRVDLSKSLLDNGTTKTQDAWASYSESARAKGEFYTPDYPLFYSILESAFDLKDDSAYKTQVEEMRTALKNFSRAKWLMTLTRVKYSQKGKDTIVHNFGLRDKYEFPEDFVGKDGELPAGSPASVYQSLLGTKSQVDKIKNVFTWLNNTPIYVYRVNSKTNTERVARFDAVSGRAGLVCDGSPSDSYSSLGVRLS